MDQRSESLCSLLNDLLWLPAAFRMRSNAFPTWLGPLHPVRRAVGVPGPGWGTGLETPGLALSGRGTWGRSLAPLDRTPPPGRQRGELEESLVTCSQLPSKGPPP